MNHNDDNALLRELFTAEGSGTQISEEPFRRVRPAAVSDVAGIVELIRPLEESDVLVPRPRGQLEQELEYFLVAEIDEIVIGCCALYPFGAAAELACVAVHPAYRDAEGGGVGTSLLAAAEQKAREQGIGALFALTTQTADWFVGHGFVITGPEALPMPRQALYNNQRNSQVLLKRLDGS